MKITGSNYAFIAEDGTVGGLAIVFMRNRPPNADGSIGYMAEPDTPEWHAWEAYFSQSHADEHGVIRDSFPQQLAHMRARAGQRKPYMVPARMPQIFDSTFTASSIRRKAPDKTASEMTTAERAAIVERFRKAATHKEAAE